MASTRPSPEAVRFWNVMRQAPAQVSLPIKERRDAGEHAEDGTEEPQGVLQSDWPEHRGLRLSPDRGEVTARVLYLFGGGYVLGSPASRRKTAGHLALAASAEVFVPGYRLAPEHPYPAGLDDVTSAWNAITDTELPCFVAGDSSGGGLALALSVALSGSLPAASSAAEQARDRRAPVGVVAFSPWADLTCSGASFDDDHADRDIECTRASLLEMAGWYAPDVDRHDPLVSPVFADPTHFGSVLAFVGSEEVLLDDAARIIRAVGGAGGDATLVVGAGLQHVYPIWCGVFPEAREALEITGAWVRARSAAAPTDPAGGRPL